jgi:hypothetical protein
VVGVANLGAEAVGGFVSSTVIQAALESPARSMSRASVRKSSWRSIKRRSTWRFQIKMPRLRNSVTNRRTVICP